MLSLLLIRELLLLGDFVQEFIKSLPFSQAAEAGPSQAGACFGPGLSTRLSGILTEGFSDISQWSSWSTKLSSETLLLTFCYHFTLFTF